MFLVVPFGILFGVVATEAGLPVDQVLSFSAVIIAGAAQFTALSLMEENAPALVVVLTALAVNLRMAMYSATLAPFLGKAHFWQKVFMAYGLFDLNFIMADQTFREKTGWSVAQRAAYFSGTSIMIIVFWIMATWIGVTIGRAIPDWLPIEFAIPLAFVAMIAPGLRTIAHVVAALASVFFALALAFVPFGLGLLIAALIAMCLGAEVERRITK